MSHGEEPKSGRVLSFKDHSARGISLKRTIANPTTGYRGGDPKKVIESLQKRYAPTEIVDEVIALWNDAYQSQSGHLSQLTTSTYSSSFARKMIYDTDTNSNGIAARYKATQFGAKINAVQKEIGKLKKVGDSSTTGFAFYAVSFSPVLEADGIFDTTRPNKMQTTC